MLMITAFLLFFDIFAFFIFCFLYFCDALFDAIFLMLAASFDYIFDIARRDAAYALMLKAMIFLPSFSPAHTTPYAAAAFAAAMFTPLRCRHMSPLLLTTMPPLMIVAACRNACRR